MIERAKAVSVERSEGHLAIGIRVVPAVPDRDGTMSAWARPRPADGRLMAAEDRSRASCRSRYRADPRCLRRERRLRDRAIILLLVRLGLACERGGAAHASTTSTGGRVASACAARAGARSCCRSPRRSATRSSPISSARRPAAGRAIAVPHRRCAAPADRPHRGQVHGRARALGGPASRAAYRGAHILRHSAATAMLRHGVSLAGRRHRAASSLAGDDRALRQGRHRAAVGDRAALAGEAAMLIDRCRSLHRAAPLARLQAPQDGAHLAAFARLCGRAGATPMSARDDRDRLGGGASRRRRTAASGGSRRSRSSRASSTPRIRAHEVPPHHPFRSPADPSGALHLHARRDCARMLDAAGNLRRQRPSPLRRQLYVTLIGLLAVDGSARLRGAGRSGSTTAARRRAAHPRDQVRQEPARADAPERGRGARRLS